MLRCQTRLHYRSVKILLAVAFSGLLLAPQPTPLHSLLTRTASEFPGRAGIFVKHLTTNETAGVRDDEIFNSASVIKIPVLVLAFQMADKGAINLDERITIRKEDIRGGSGIFRYHDAGLQPTFRDVLLQMVITSDNTATDLAMAKVGGVERVNAWLKESGYSDGQHLVQTTGDLFAKYNALGPNDDRNAKTNSDRSYWLGEITPRGVGLMLEAIEKKTIASKAACDDMLRMMRAQQSGARRLNHFITVPVAHKTGDFSPVLANQITGNYGEAEDRIGRFGQQLLEYFDK